jgi:hypothetical protein
MTITLKQQIEEVSREITMRQSVYRRQVSVGKMTQEQADLKIEIMRAVLKTLQSPAVLSQGMQ